MVASPVFGGGLLFSGSSYEKQRFVALDLKGAKGDLTNTKHVIWRRIRRTPYVPSPLLYDGHLYFFAHYQNILLRVEATTGNEVPGPMRLEGLRNIYASPIAASGRIYIPDLQGNTLVMRTGPEPEVLGLNRLPSAISASPAVADDTLFLRTTDTLFALENSPPPPAPPSP